MPEQTTNHPGWKPEGFKREQLTPADLEAILDEVRARIESHLRDYGAGIFMHPQEIVGCMFGQQIKLSQSADASVYTDDLVDFKERCMKTFMAILIGTASVDKLAELREKERDTLRKLLAACSVGS